MIKIVFRVEEKTHTFEIANDITAGYIDGVIDKLYGKAVVRPLPPAKPSTLSDLSADDLVELMEEYYEYVQNHTIGERLLSPQAYRFGEELAVDCVGEVKRERTVVGIVSVTSSKNGKEVPYYTDKDYEDNDLDDYGDQPTTEAEVRDLIQYLLYVDKLSQVSLETFSSVFLRAIEETNNDRKGIVGRYRRGNYSFYLGVFDNEALGKELVKCGEFGSNISSDLYEYINFDALGSDAEYTFTSSGAIKLK